MIEKISKSAQNKSNKRKAIFRAAIENFARNGFYETKMSEIAKEAKVADGTIYLYYKNKDELFIKVFEEMIDDKLNAIKAVVDLESNALTKLHKFFSLHIELFTDSPSYTKFFVQEIRQSPDFYTRYPEFKPIKNYLQYLEELIQEAIQQGLVRPLNVHLVARMIYGSIDFLLTEWALNNDNFSLETVHEIVIDLLHNGMKSQVQK